jgi:hypothetical protein
MPTYRCPECEAVLRREQPVPDGKKIKCPKCEFVFAAKPVREETPAKKNERKAPKKEENPVATTNKDALWNEEDEDEVGSYEVKQTEEPDDKPELYFGSLRDKYAKSKRGPAMARTVIPSNILIGEGILTCLGGLGVVVWAVFPLVFHENPLTEKIIREQILWIIIGVLIFLWGAMICLGASKLQNLDSYTWAMVGACMGIVPLLGGIYAIIIMRDENIIAGFEETAELKKKRELVQ